MQKVLSAGDTTIGRAIAEWALEVLPLAGDNLRTTTRRAAQFFAAQPENLWWEPEAYTLSSLAAPQRLRLLESPALHSAWWAFITCYCEDGTLHVLQECNQASASPTQWFKWYTSRNEQTKDLALTLLRAGYAHPLETLQTTVEHLTALHAVVS